MEILLKHAPGLWKTGRLLHRRESRWQKPCPLWQSGKVKRLLLSAALIAATLGLAAEMAQIQPRDLAAQLSAAKVTRPAVLYVGPAVMYRSKHIPGAVFAGPGNRAEGLDLLKAAVKNFPKDREIVIYCGCCPWNVCPNISPAFATLRQMGYTRVKAMYSPVGFKVDWIDKGYPVE
jgi:thiosulfate/3-mercaptopyruvate sulfurtransferase